MSSTVVRIIVLLYRHSRYYIMNVSVCFGMSIWRRTKVGVKGCMNVGIYGVMGVGVFGMYVH